MGSVGTPTALVYNNAALSIGDNVITAGVGGKRIYVTQYSVTSSVPLTLQSTDKTIKVLTTETSGSYGGTSQAVLPLGVGLIATVTQAGTASGYIMGFTA